MIDEREDGYFAARRTSNGSCGLWRNEGEKLVEPGHCCNAHIFHRAPLSNCDSLVREKRALHFFIQHLLCECPVSSTLWLECILPKLGAREDFGQRPPSDISLYICREDIAADLPSVDDEGPLWKQPQYYALLFYSSVVIRWARWRRAQPTETTAPPPRDEVVRKQRQIGALLRLMRLKKGLSGP
jgi:hypothetical protein